MQLSFDFELAKFRVRGSIGVRSRIEGVSDIGNSRESAAHCPTPAANKGQQCAWACPCLASIHSHKQCQW